MKVTTKTGSLEVSEAKGGGYKDWLARWRRGNDEQRSAEKVKRGDGTGENLNGNQSKHEHQWCIGNSPVPSARLEKHRGGPATVTVSGAAEVFVAELL